MIVVAILIPILFLVLAHFYIEYNEHGRLIRKIPGLKGLPIVGSLFTIFKKPPQLFYLQRSLFNRFKGIYKLRTAHYSSVMLADPEYIEVILSSTKHTIKGRSYNILGSWLRSGLLVSSGEKWQSRRKLLTPAFHFSILKDAFKTFNDSTNKLVEELQLVANQEVDVNPFVARCALHAICQTAMGINLHLDNDDINSYRTALHNIAYCVLYRVARLMFNNNFLSDLTPIVKYQKKVVSDLHKFTDKVIHERRKMNYQIEQTRSRESENIFGGKKRMAMIDILLSLEKEGKIDHIGIQEECDTVAFAGHDTTTCVTRFFLLNLANNMDIQERLVEELRSVISSPDEELSLDMINKLPYMDRCLKESMRTYAPVPFISRYLSENLKMKDYTIPKGTSIGINIFDLHTNPKIYPNPYKYDPERFNPENCAKRHPFAFIPFSAGPRNCIGQKLASFEVKSIMVAILRNFVILPVTTPEEIKYTLDLVLTTIDPIKVIFKPREEKI